MKEKKLVDKQKYLILTKQDGEQTAVWSSTALFFTDCDPKTENVWTREEVIKFRKAK